MLLHCRLCRDKQRGSCGSKGGSVGGGSPTRVCRLIVRVCALLCLHEYAYICCFLRPCRHAPFTRHKPRPVCAVQAVSLRPRVLYKLPCVLYTLPHVLYKLPGVLYTLPCVLCKKAHCSLQPTADGSLPLKPSLELNLCEPRGGVHLESLEAEQAFHPR